MNINFSSAKEIFATSDFSRIISLIIFAVFIKILVISGSNVINPDGVRYANSAYNLMNGDYTTAFLHEKMLVYSLVLGFFHLLTDDWMLAGQLLSATFLILTIFPLYHLTKCVFQANAAFWAVLMFILLPSGNVLTASVVKDAPFLFFLLSALYFGYKSLAENRPLYCLLTFCCGFLATMFRFEAVIFLALYFVRLLFLVSYRPSAERWVLIRSMVIYLSIPMVCLLGVSGLLLFGVFDVAAFEQVWQRFHSHYFQTNLTGNYYAIYDHLKSVERNFPGGQWTNDFFEIARYNLPLIYLMGMLQKLVDVLFPVYVIPLYFGIKAARLSQGNKSLLVWTIFAYLGTAYFFIVTRNFLSGRYLLIVALMLLPFVGHGLERLRESLATTRFPKTVAVVAVTLFILAPLYETFADTRKEKIEIRLAGEWLRDNRDVLRQRIITNDERIPFYAGLMRGGYEVIPYEQSMNYADTALARQCSLMVLELSLREEGKLSDFVNFQRVREFRGDRKVVLIYETNQ